MTIVVKTVRTAVSTSVTGDLPIAEEPLAPEEEVPEEPPRPALWGGAPRPQSPDMLSEFPPDQSEVASLLSKSGGSSVLKTSAASKPKPLQGAVRPPGGYPKTPSIRSGSAPDQASQRGAADQSSIRESAGALPQTREKEVKLNPLVEEYDVAPIPEKHEVEAGCCSWLCCKKKKKKAKVAPAEKNDPEAKRKQKEKEARKKKKAADKKKRQAAKKQAKNAGFFARVFGKDHEYAETSNLNIMMLGLDNSGKTTFVGRCARVRIAYDYTPTKKCACHTYNGPAGETITLYDIGGRSRYRGSWTNYVAEVHGAIFVVDSADPSRLLEAKQALHDIYGDERLFGKPLMIVANKQDNPIAISQAELYKALDVASLTRYRDADEDEDSDDDDDAGTSNAYGKLENEEEEAEKSDGEIVRDQVFIARTRSLPSREEEPDNSVDLALRELLDRIKLRISDLQERVDEDVLAEEDRFKRELEEHRKRVHQYREHRATEKVVKRYAESARYPRAPML